MNNYQTIFVRNLSSIFADVKIWNSTAIKDSSCNKHTHSLWFRGHSNHNYSLIPSLYRLLWDQSDKKFAHFWTKMQKHEQRLINEFRARTFPTTYLSTTALSKHEQDMIYLCAMQHEELATRLLDWSESLIIAIGFSLLGYLGTRYKHKIECKNDPQLPCVWVLNPLRLNNYFSRGQDYIPGILEKSLESSRQTQISAVIPPLNTERIKMQSGVFTIFPTTPKFYRKKRIDFQDINDLGLEKFPDNGNFLRKYTILNPKELASELHFAGTKVSNLFPEHTNLSSDIEDNLLKNIW